MKSSLRFIDYIVDEISFKNKYVEGEDFNIDFSIDTDVVFKDENNFILKLSMNIFKDQEQAPFEMNVSVIGIFEVDNIEENLKKEFAEKNSVAILFPYVRALVSNYTAVANVTPLILPPINVVKYIEDKKKLKSAEFNGV